MRACLYTRTDHNGCRLSDFADIFVSLHNAFDACDGKLAGRTTFGHGAMCVEAVKREKKDSALDADRDGSVSYHGPRRRAREEASDVIFIFAHAGRQWKPAT